MLSCLGQRPDVWSVDAAPYNPGGFVFVHPQVGIVDAPRDLLEPMEMEENEWLVIDEHGVAVHPNLVVCEVPGGEVGALVMQNNDALKAAGPVVEVFLICEAAVLVSVIAPLQAFLPPPVQAVECMGIASKAHPSHV